MDISKDFASPDLEKEGVWMAFRDGARVKLARLGNPNFVRVNEIRMKPYARKRRNGTLEPDVETRVLCEVMSETVLLDWEGFKDGGKDLKYTPQVAAALLVRHMDFRNEIVEMASQSEAYHVEEEADAAKN